MAEAYLELECGRATREEHVDGYWTDDGWQDPQTLQVPYGPGHRISLGAVSPDAEGRYFVSVPPLRDCPLCGARIRYVRVVYELPDKPNPAASWDGTD